MRDRCVQVYWVCKFSHVLSGFSFATTSRNFSLMSKVVLIIITTQHLLIIIRIFLLSQPPVSEACYEEGNMEIRSHSLLERVQYQYQYQDIPLIILRNNKVNFSTMIGTLVTC